MIIDFAYIVELARGVERRIMQEGDVQLLVPPVLQVGVDLVLPHNFAVGTGTLLNNSGTATFNLTKTNGAATNQEILRLPPGLYTIQCELTTRANYTTIGVATPDSFVDISLFPTFANPFTLLSHWATVGSNVRSFAEYRFMLTDTQVIRVRVQPNGVGQTIDSAVNVNVVRHL